MDCMKRLNPKFALRVTMPVAAIINDLQLLLCAFAIAIGKSAPAFSMSVGALLFINGLMPIMGCAIVKGYAPGVITGGLLYLPLSVYAYHHAITSGQLTRNGVILSAVLGIL